MFCSWHSLDWLLPSLLTRQCITPVRLIFGFEVTLDRAAVLLALFMQEVPLRQQEAHALLELWIWLMGLQMTRSILVEQPIWMPITYDTSEEVRWVLAGS